MAENSDRLKDKIKKKDKKKNLTENRIEYDQNNPEKMHPELEEKLRNRDHSLGNNPAFPEEDERNFEESIMGERFNEVVNRYKRHHDVDQIDPNECAQSTMRELEASMNLEKDKREDLQELAERMIREEFDMSEEDVDIVAELVGDPSQINDSGLKDEPVQGSYKDYGFEDHGEVERANKEVYKRRVLNAINQGSAKKSTHMFHMKEDELSQMDPQLPTKYSKLTSGADYMYYLYGDDAQKEMNMSGGIVHVEFPQEEGEKPTIHAQALVFPVLVHELSKGAMELLSSHGLPEESHIRKYVVDKADYKHAEFDDMRIGPAMWQKIMELIDFDNLHLKHHVYSELAALPVDDFNEIMKEILSGTRKGKEFVDTVIREVKTEIENDEYEKEMNEYHRRMGGTDDPNDLNDLGDEED